MTPLTSSEQLDIFNDFGFEHKVEIVLCCTPVGVWTVNSNNGRQTSVCSQHGPFFLFRLGLDCLSMTAISELIDELQRCVHEYSAELVSELARRDELDFEKELKNQFIWLLLRVQKRRREAQLDVRPAAAHRRSHRVISNGVGQLSSTTLRANDNYFLKNFIHLSCVAVAKLS